MLGLDLACILRSDNWGGGGWGESEDNPEYVGDGQMAAVAGQSGGLGSWVPGAWSSRCVWGGGGWGKGENYWCVWSSSFAIFL